MPNRRAPDKRIVTAWLTPAEFERLEQQRRPGETRVDALKRLIAGEVTSAA